MCRIKLDPNKTMKNEDDKLDFLIKRVPATMSCEVY